jgi:quinolinate synthase
MNAIEKIKKLKKERNAVILAHNYELPEIQDIADFLGDSLGLSIQASKTKADVIVFCGVYFMAETAKIVSPDKTVIIPEKQAGCPMADMISAEQLKKTKELYPKASVLCYVNTPAEVKAESDLCCTSANAIDVANYYLKDVPEVLFVPDKYLANYVSVKTQRPFISWGGYCPCHERITARDIIIWKEMHPHALTVVHPECTPEVIALADSVQSTEGMVSFIKRSKAKEFIIGTEIGIIHRLKKENPVKKFYPSSDLSICEDMKKITLDKIVWSLETMGHEITLPEEIIKKARHSIDKMLALNIRGA